VALIAFKSVGHLVTQQTQLLEVKLSTEFMQGLAKFEKANEDGNSKIT